MVAFLGVALARAVAAPLNPSYTEDENKFYMEDAASKLLIVPAHGSKHAEAAASGLNIPVASISILWAYGACSTPPCMIGSSSHRSDAARTKT